MLVNISGILKSVKYSPPSYEKVIYNVHFHSGRIGDEYIIRINAKGDNLEQSTIEVIYKALDKPK